MRTRLFTADSGDVAESLHDMAACLERMGRNADALPKFQAAAEMVRRFLPGDDWRVALCVSDFAGCLRELGRPREALQLFEESLAM